MDQPLLLFMYDMVWGKHYCCWFKMYLILGENFYLKN